MKSLKEYVFEQLKNGKELNPKDIFAYRLKKNDVAMAQIHKLEYERIERDTKFFKGKKITEVRKYPRLLLALVDGERYRISKAYCIKRKLKIKND